MFLYIEGKQVDCQGITQKNGLNLQKSLARHATRPPRPPASPVRLACLAGGRALLAWRVRAAQARRAGAKSVDYLMRTGYAKILIYAINYNILPVIVLFLF